MPNFLSKLNPFAGYRDPTLQGMDGAFNQGGPFMPPPEQYPEEETGPMNPRMIPGIREAFAPPNPNMELPPEQAEPTALERYQQALNERPYQDGYHPTKKRIFGGIALGGLAGMAANNPQMAYGMARNIVRSPYDNSMEQWKTSTTGFKDAAQLEETANAHEDNRAYREASLASLTANRQAIDADRDEARRLRESDLATKNAMAERKQKLAEDLANGGEIVKLKNGKIYFNDKKGTVRPLDIKDYSAEEIMNFQTNGRIKVINTEASLRRQLARENHERTQSNIRLRSDLSGTGSGSETTSTSERNLSASELEKQRKARVSEFVRDHPEMDEDWVVPDAAGRLVLKPEPGFWDSFSKEDQQDLVDEFNSYVDSGPTTTTTKRTSTRTPTKSGGTGTGSPPPLEQRKSGVTKWTFTGPDGKPVVRTWNGTGWK